MKFIKDYFAARKQKHEAKLIGWLREAGVPEELFQEALTSLRDSNRTYWKYVFWIKITAWLVCLPMVWFMKWEDEDVPKFFRWYGNNISPNGDRTNWAEDKEGYGRRLPQPLDKKELFTNYGEKFNYYAWNFHVRFWLSRYIWMGTRNPGAGRALQVGPSVFHLRFKDEHGRFHWPVETWGKEGLGKKKDGEIIYGTQVHRIGHHWQITNWRRLDHDSIIGMESNIGYKINNLGADFPPNEPTAALCVCNGHKPFVAK
jgi:hypothetical protein